MMNRFCFILLPIFFLLAGCASQAPTAQAEIASSATPTAVPTATATPTPLPTSTPTASPTPTATATPTPTPITLPVTNGTPIPDLPYEVITAENVHRLRQIARYGYPRLLDTNPYRLTVDGKTIVVGTTLGLEFYDARTQEKTGGFEVEFLRDFDLTPDGQYLLTLAGEGVLTVWTRDGEKVREFDVEAGDAWALKAVALSPDGALLAVQRPRGQVVEQDKVDVYRVSDGTLLDTGRGMGAVFSPDGQYLATVFDGSVRLYPVAELGEGWEKRLPKQTLPWCGVMEGGCGLVFSPDGTLAAVVRAGRVDVYHAAERKLVRQVSGWEVKDTYYLPQVQFAPNGEQMLITTLAVYDSQGEVQTPAQAIVVDVASGEWVSRNEVEEGFAYWDGEKVRTFTWKAEGEMPPYGIKWMHPRLMVSNEGSTKLSVVDWWAFGWGQEAEAYLCENEICNLTKFTQDVTLPGFTFIRESTNGYVFRDEKNKTIVPVSDWMFGYLLDDNVFLWSVSYSPSYGKTMLIDLESGKTLLQTAYVHPVFFEVVGDEAIMMTNENKVIVFDLSERILKKHSRSGLEKDFTYSPIGYSPVSSVTIKTATDGKKTIGCYYYDSICERIIYEDIFSMAFSPNGRLFATYGADGFIRVWAVVPESAPVR